MLEASEGDKNEKDSPRVDREKALGADNHDLEIRQSPELPLDSQRTPTPGWMEGDFWLHSSFNLDEGEGEYNV